MTSGSASRDFARFLIQERFVDHLNVEFLISKGSRPKFNHIRCPSSSLRVASYSGTDY